MFPTIQRAEILYVAPEREHVLILQQNVRGPRLSHQGKGGFEVGDLWGGALQVQVDHAATGKVSGRVSRNSMTKAMFKTHSNVTEVL